MNESSMNGSPEKKLKETEKSKIESERIKNTAEMLEPDYKNNFFHIDKFENPSEDVRARILEDEDGEIHFIPSRHQLKMARYDMYLGLLQNEIDKAKEEGRDKEARLLKSRLISDKEILGKTWSGGGFDRNYGDYRIERSDIDVVTKGDTTKLVIPEDVIKSARREMERNFILRGEIQEFIQTLPWREEIWDEAEKQTFYPIPFRENMSQVFSTFELGENETVSQRTKREGVKALEKYLSNEDGPYNYIGSTANSRDEDVPIEIIQGIEVATGEKISAKRVDSVHFSYNAKNLGAISLVLKSDVENEVLQELDKKISQTYKDFPLTFGQDGFTNSDDQSREKERLISETKKEHPLLFDGTLIIKLSGEKYFLPGIIWKQYPYLRPNGKMVMTFAGGPSRGIFDEDHFFASREIDSSAAKLKLPEGDADKDSYYYDEGVGHHNGKTYFKGREMPRALFYVDQKTNTRIYKLDVMDQMMEILPEEKQEEN